MSVVIISQVKEVIYVILITNKLRRYLVSIKRSQICMCSLGKVKAEVEDGKTLVDLTSFVSTPCHVKR